MWWVAWTRTCSPTSRCLFCKGWWRHASTTSASSPWWRSCSPMQGCPASSGTGPVQCALSANASTWAAPMRGCRCLLTRLLKAACTRSQRGCMTTSSTSQMAFSRLAFLDHGPSAPNLLGGWRCRDSFACSIVAGWQVTAWSQLVLAQFVWRAFLFYSIATGPSLRCW